MAVQFVIGRAGSGKTSFCLDQIKRACIENPLGPTLFWILPRQATFTAERSLTCNSGLGAIARVQVVSFEQLQREILEECGGVTVPPIDAFGRRMVLGHLLREHESSLTSFKLVARKPGLAREIDATFGELERSGVTTQELIDAVKSEGAEFAGPLTSKLADLHRLYAAYDKFIGQDRLDGTRRVEQVIEQLDSSSVLRSADVYVDGFYEFTAHELRLLVEIARRARSMTITMTLDPSSKVLNDPHWICDDHCVFRKTETAYRKLFLALQAAEVAPAEHIRLASTRRFNDPLLQRVEKWFGDTTAGEPAREKSDGVTFVECANRRAEVFAAARYIRKLLADGMRMRDVVVLARDLNDYLHLIEVVFPEFELSYFVDHRRSASHHPLIQFVRALPDLVLRNLSHDAIIALLKCRLLPLGPDALATADDLENYAIEHQIKGRAWIQSESWAFTRKRSRDEESGPMADPDAQRMDEARRIAMAPLVPFIEALRAPTRLESLVQLLRQAMEQAGVRSVLEGWISLAVENKQLEEAAEHEQAWSQLDELLDEMTSLLGDQVVSAEHFAQVLESGLEAFDLAITPPTIDQVLVGDLDRTRTIDAKAAVVLGLMDGHFPACPREDSVFADSDRQALRKRKCDLDLDTRLRLCDERFLGYVGFTRASDALCVTRAIADDAGHPIGPSRFWHELREALPGAPVHSIPAEHECDARHISTPRQLVSSVIRWARDVHRDSPDFAAMYDKVRLHAEADAISRTRSIAWKALNYSNDARISPEIAAKLFPSPLDSSVSRIESFANCPFKHFVDYGLRLEQRAEPEVTGMDLGSIYHGVLERIVRDLTERSANWDALPRDCLPQRISELAHEIGGQLRNELMLSSARNRYLLSHIEKTVADVIDSQAAIAARGRFTPLKAELDFGFDGGALPALGFKTPAGRRLALRGRIDRVDVLVEQAAVAVIDYKLGGKTLDLYRVYHGLSLQLLVYLLVLERNGTKLIGSRPTPAAAFYVTLLRRLESVDHPSKGLSRDDPAFHLVKPRGILDVDFLSALDTKLEAGPSDVVLARIGDGGAIVDAKRSDAATAQELRSVLRLVERKVCEIADEIMDGDISLSPHMIGNVTACAHCDFRALCRFDITTNSYRKLEVLSRPDVLTRCLEESE